MPFDTIADIFIATFIAFSVAALVSFFIALYYLTILAWHLEEHHPEAWKEIVRGSPPGADSLAGRNKPNELAFVFKNDKLNDLKVRQLKKRVRNILYFSVASLLFGGSSFMAAAFIIIWSGLNSALKGL